MVLREKSVNFTKISGCYTILQIFAALIFFILTIGSLKAYGVDYAELSFEELININVVTVSKKEKKLSESPAAVYVVTSDDIHKSGATTIPEVLRMVPGLQVAQINSDSWAISSRGFSDAFANKLLVLIDGRSVYTHFYSGVYWHMNDTMIEDIERIEVIRGPGGTLWGANAVSGIINIITKKAIDSQGSLVTAGIGDEEKAFGSVRYGGKIDDDIYYKIFAKYFNRDSTVDKFGHDKVDDWKAVRFGFKVEWYNSKDNFFALQGGASDGETEDTTSFPSLTPPFLFESISPKTFSGAYFIGKWQHTYSDTSDMTFKCYYDRKKYFERDRRKDNSHYIRLIAETIDFDFQHSFAMGSRNEVIWGTGLRLIYDTIKDKGPIVSFDDDNRSFYLYSAFVQDEISLIKNKLLLTIGTKLEHNDFTGFEFQPCIRMLWAATKRNIFWASVARAVRTPSRYEADLEELRQNVIPPYVSNNPLPILIFLKGSHEFDSEKLFAYELGYRVQPTDRLSIDVATFYNDYDDLRTLEFGAQTIKGLPPYINQPLLADNNMDGETYGMEIAVNCDIVDRWRIRTSYSYLQMHLHPDSNSSDSNSKNDQDKSPHNQFAIYSFWKLPFNLHIDLSFKYVDNLPALNVSSYTTLDTRFSWEPGNRYELSIVGKNLLEDRHEEFWQQALVPAQAEIERSVYGKFTVKF